jgi:predicted metallo-beta-lactamase superfamily hydrolase
MTIIPLSAESMGVRSTATVVETPDVKILLDPGAGVGYGNGLEPHPLETWCLATHLERIRLWMRRSNVIIISWFHPDRFIEDEPELYRGKTIFIKNPNQFVNTRQRNKAFRFLRQVQSIAKDVSFADGREFRIRGTRFVFSDAMPVGDKEQTGGLIQTALRTDETCWAFTSDAQGFRSDAHLDFIIGQKPHGVYCDGPATYLGSGKIKASAFLLQLEKLFGSVSTSQIILDHHVMRDPDWWNTMEPVVRLARDANVQVQTAAELRGETNNPLEARRKSLYEESA